MSEATMTEEKPAYTLLAEPESFLEIETGLVRETYVFDGTNIQFALGETAVVFHDFTLTLVKQQDDTLQFVHVDVMNLPVPTLRQIGTLTGAVLDDTMADADTVMVRFSLRPDSLALCQLAMDGARSLGEFLDTVDPADATPLLWNLAHYYTDSVISGE